MNSQVLENRLIDFAVNIISQIRQLPHDLVTRRLSDQLVRSSSSTALNYGEAKAAESKKDFIHKMRIILKELRETQICLKILRKSNYKISESLIDECGQLIAIFYKSIKTTEERFIIKKQKRSSN